MNVVARSGVLLGLASIVFGCDTDDQAPTIATEPQFQTHCSAEQPGCYQMILGSQQSAEFSDAIDELASGSASYCSTIAQYVEDAFLGGDLWLYNDAQDPVYATTWIDTQTGDTESFTFNDAYIHDNFGTDGYISQVIGHEGYHSWQSDVNNSINYDHSTATQYANTCLNF